MRRVRWGLLVAAAIATAFANVKVPDSGTLSSELDCLATVSCGYSAVLATGCGIRGAYFAMPLHSSSVNEGILLSETCVGSRCEPVHIRMFDATLYVVHEGLPNTLALTATCKFRSEVNLERKQRVSRMKLYGVANAR